MLTLPAMQLEAGRSGGQLVRTELRMSSESTFKGQEFMRLIGRPHGNPKRNPYLDRSATIYDLGGKPVRRKPKRPKPPRREGDAPAGGVGAPRGVLSEAHESALQQEIAMKRRLNKLQQQLTKSASTSAIEAVRARNRATAAQLKEELVRMSETEMKDDLAAVEPAPPELLSKLAVAFHERLDHLYPDNKGGWFKLFRILDRDSSGLVTFPEMLRMVRVELRMSERRLPMPTLMSVWAAIDVDSDGHITAAEFGKFMRVGEREIARQKRRALDAARPRTPTDAESQADKAAAKDFRVRVAVDVIEHNTQKMQREVRRRERALAASGYGDAAAEPGRPARMNGPPAGHMRQSASLPQLPMRGAAVSQA